MFRILPPHHLRGIVGGGGGGSAFCCFGGATATLLWRFCCCCTFFCVSAAEAAQKRREEKHRLQRRGSCLRGGTLAHKSPHSTYAEGDRGSKESKCKIQFKSRGGCYHVPQDTSSESESESPPLDPESESSERSSSHLPRPPPPPRRRPPASLALVSRVVTPGRDREVAVSVDETCKSKFLKVFRYLSRNYRISLTIMVLAFGC